MLRRLWSRLPKARILTAVWALWGIRTSVAYIDGAPDVLAETEEVLHLPLSVVWGIIAALLLVGTFRPNARRGRCRPLRRFTEAATAVGIGLTSAMLGLWGIQFWFGPMERGWVTGTSYLYLAAGAASSGWYIGTMFGGEEKAVDGGT